MLMLKKLFFVALLVPSLSLGSEKPAEAKSEEKKDQKAEEKKLPEWVEIQGRISALESKVSSKQSNINKLIEDKKKLPSDSPQVRDIVKQLVTEYKEYREAVLEYEKQTALLKYRFPERGMKDDRKYEVIELKTLDEMEAQLGIDGRLDRNMKRLQQQYGSPQVNQAEKKKSTKPNKASETDRPISESPSIILQK